MPKATTARSTRARADPLTATDANASKTRQSSRTTKRKQTSKKFKEESAADGHNEEPVKNEDDASGPAAQSKKGKQSSKDADEEPTVDQHNEPESATQDQKSRGGRKGATAKTKAASLEAENAKSSKAQKQGIDNQAAPAATGKPSPPDNAVNYLLLVSMLSTDDPTVTRLLHVPSTLTFDEFHEVLQVAFGWTNSHAFCFGVSKLLEEDETPNWLTGRGEEVLNLSRHMKESLAAAYPDPHQMKVARDYTLADIYESDEYGGKTEVSYEYDHGDSWDHSVAFLGRADPVLKRSMHIPDDVDILCLGGEGHPVAEDCGGAGGWEELKAAFKKRSRDSQELKSWYKESCYNGDPKGLDPYKWSILDVNDNLQELAEHLERRRGRGRGED